MTGYGREVIHKDTSTTVSVEIRSVNHRYLDISIKAPRSLLFLEDQIKRMIQQRFKRGRIEIYINIEGEEFVSRTLTTDWRLLDQYIDTMQQIKKTYDLFGDIPLSMLTTLPEIITVQETEEESDELVELLTTCISRACEQVLSARIKEGDFLLKDVQDRMKTVHQTVSLLDELKPKVIEEYRQRITERINHFISGDMIDENRLHQEIAYLIERGDITEELTRLFAHIEHFNNLLTSDDPIGRKLDFIIQEMHREMNTIGAKSIDSEMSEKVVRLKSEIEKIREQIQNIE